MKNEEIQIISSLNNKIDFKDLNLIDTPTIENILEFVTKPKVQPRCWGRAGVNVGDARPDTESCSGPLKF